MSAPWIPWSDRIEEFAPVVGLHKLELFFPTTIEAMITKSCELMVFLGPGSTPKAPMIGRVEKFAEAPFSEKIQMLISRKINHKHNYLDRHGGKVDVRESARIQNDLQAPKNVYVRGFRNEETGEAYIVYRFFYVENLITRSDDESEIADQLMTHPDKWWSHEGDWEGISMHFKDDYQASVPDEVAFSRHKKSLPLEWKKVERVRGRVQALPALSTHATYNKEGPITLPASKFLPGKYFDLVQPDVVYYPESIAQSGDKTYQLTELEPRLEHLWLHYKGRWGEGSSIAEQSPRGPLVQKRKHFTLLADRK